MKIIWNIPNIISASRLMAAPFLLWLAWAGYPTAFLIGLALSWASDGLDGFLARRWHQQTEFGARLDTWSDSVLFTTVALGGLMLWPERMSEEWPWIIAILASYLLPGLLGLIKFGSTTSYHTILVKLSVVLVAAGAFALFLLDWRDLLKVAAIISVIAGLEECLLTLTLDQPRSNVGFWWQEYRRTKS